MGGKRRRGERKEEGGSERRNFKPSQCWKQIDATGERNRENN